MPSFVNAVGRTSAGVIGYITGGIKGAKKSVVGFDSYQNSMKRKAQVVVVPNKRVKGGTSYRKSRKGKVILPRKSMKARKGKARTSRKSIKRASRALNKRIRTVAIKAIHGEEPTGKYVKNVLYHLPNSIGSGSLATQTVVNSALFGGSNTHDGQFVVGSYSKLVDALSILWSSKTAGFYTSTGDLSTAGMIVPYISHTARYEFVNNTTVTQVMLCYECVTKEDTNASVYSNWNAMTVVQKGGTTRGTTFFGMRPEYYPQFKEQYSFTKKEIRLKPGERVILSQNVSQQHLKFDSWAPIGGGTPFVYRKNFTKELLIISWNAVTAGLGAVSTRPGITLQVPGQDYYTIGVHMTDIITCKMPENLSTTANLNNTLAVWNQYDNEVSTGGTNTVQSPSVTLVSAGQ